MANCAVSVNRIHHVYLRGHVQVRHVYSDRTRGELQVGKNYFFCSELMDV